jgi:hypothetical protein
VPDMQGGKGSMSPHTPGASCVIAKSGNESQLACF